jgi:hypothetical protein
MPQYLRQSHSTDLLIQSPHPNPSLLFSATISRQPGKIPCATLTFRTV